jgi:hypothetical protein
MHASSLRQTAKSLKCVRGLEDFTFLVRLYVASLIHAPRSDCILAECNAINKECNQGARELIHAICTAYSITHKVWVVRADAIDCCGLAMSVGIVYNELSACKAKVTICWHGHLTCNRVFSSTDSNYTQVHCGPLIKLQSRSSMYCNQSQRQPCALYIGMQNGCVPQTA